MAGAVNEAAKSPAPSAVAKVVMVLEALLSYHGVSERSERPIDSRALARAGAKRRIDTAEPSLAPERSGGVSEISRSTGLPTSTVHRILRELSGLGWVRVDSEHRYLPGVRLLSLAGQTAGVTHIVRPILQGLCSSTGHTVHFALLSGEEAVYVDKLEGDRAYGMRSRVGLSIPLHCTAIGKAILACLPRAELRELLTRMPLPAMTARTITDPDLLIAHLDNVARRGYSVDDEENEEHTRCLGVAVLDPHGRPIGGISVSALTFDLDRVKVRACAPLLIAAAREASQALGLPGAAPRPPDGRSG
ncbi:IclR family transcriptional regulator [Nocardia sp. NEAU-G5]|uniref:IclR family transcriptional regulator n=1 Tax=Nocardia albiluteola TaxID=2842303 RepID=A0ABS6B4T6_9NOCA|nr:IclR family transcriptional regulator [Nocardia albiluteola]MBU3065330.1 IclR family transcriptional regulator [Nocardia albiluteola]